MIELIRPLEIYMLKEVCKFYKKMESTHGTPPATGIASFRSTTTAHSVPLISFDVKQYFEIVVLVVYAFMLATKIRNENMWVLVLWRH